MQMEILLKALICTDNRMVYINYTPRLEKKGVSMGTDLVGPLNTPPLVLTWGRVDIIQF